MSTYVNEKGEPIQQCNVFDNGSDAHLHVYDVDAYRKTSTTVQQARQAGMVSGAVFAVFMVIFSLNYGSAGWTMGNIITFVIAIASLLVVAASVKKWNEHNAFLTQMRQQGVPCIVSDGATSMVHCNV